MSDFSILSFFWISLFDLCSVLFFFARDEILTKNKFLEEEAKRKAEMVDNGEDSSVQQDPQDDSGLDDSQQDDDVFYDSDGNEREEE